MKKTYFALFLAFLVIGLMAATNATAQQLRPVKIVVLGDSLTSGYQIAEEHAFSKILEQKLLSDGYQTEVINMSRQGMSSADALASFEHVLAVNPDIVILQLGMTDASRGLDPIKVLFMNLHKMMVVLKEKNIGMVLAGVKAPETASRAYKDRLDYAYRKAAKEYRATLYLDIMDGVHGRYDLTLADGIHPNSDGVLAMVHNLSPYVARLVAWRIDLQNYQNSVK